MSRLAILAAAFSLAISAHAQRHGDLLGMLRSGDAKQRALARQLLPRENVEIVHDVLPVLAHENEAIWRTASNVLADFANEVSSPGREADRRHVAHEMLARLAASPGRDEAARLLNLVHLVLPDGADVAPIAAYLSDESLRMNARDALQLAGTAESCAALRSALPAAQGTFALALMDSLRLLRDPDAVDVLAARLDDPDPAIRAGAARALAWTGDADLVDRFQRVVKNAPGDQYVESGDALLALADAMMANGGQFDRALEVYRWALDNLDGPVLRGAAIAGLGRHGDERVVPSIVDAARNGDSGVLDHAALEALAVLQGEAASKALLAARDELFKQFGASVYSVYGRRGDAVFTPLLTDALTTGDMYAKHVSALALLDSNRADGVRAVAHYALELDDEPRAQFIDALELKAAAYRRDGRADAAGAAYAGLYRLASTDQARRFALDGMMRFPTDDAFEIVKDFVDQDDFASFPVPFLAGIARALRDANRTEEAARVLDALLPRLATPEDVRAFLETARAAGTQAAAELGFVLDWRVIGPFPWSAAAGFGENPIGAPEVDTASMLRAGDGTERSWIPARGSDVDGLVNLIGVLGEHSNAAAYAYAEVVAAEAGDYVLRLGSDDGVKAWINGVVAHEHHVDRGLVADQDQAAIKLNAGTNRLLLEITQGGGGWAFCARVTRPDGTPVPVSK